MKFILILSFLIGIYAFSVKEKIPKTTYLKENSYASITKEQRAYGISELQRTKTMFQDELKGLNEKQLTFKAEADKWSIAEITEHIALAEIGIFQVVEGTLKSPADTAKRKEIKVTADDIKNRLTNRTTKVQSPEVIKPTGKFQSTMQAFQAYAARRNATIDYLRQTNDDLLNRFWKHPATGTIDLYQTILLISAHSERHILQIREVKSNEKFPTDN